MFPAKTNPKADQAEALRRLVRAQPRATSIAVTSGKGGVGKTNVAVNLALALATRQHRVAVVDVDLGLANADLLLGVSARRNLAHVLSGRCGIEDILVEGPAGVRLVPGASGLEGLADLSEFERHRLLSQFQLLEHDCDFLIMDLGAGVSRNVLGFAAAADHILVVTTPEPTALADAYATIKLLTHDAGALDIEVLVNQAHGRQDARQAYERLASVASRFLGLPLTFAGYVLCDEVVPLAVRAREPFLLKYPRCNASACIRALAKRFVTAAPPPQQQQDTRGFFRRVADIFQ